MSRAKLERTGAVVEAATAVTIILVILTPVVSTSPAVRAAPRQLLTTGYAACPEGCSPSGCFRVSSSSSSSSSAGGWRCQKCERTLMLDASGRCGCPAGKYASGAGCADCPKGSWCPGGLFSSSSSSSSSDSRSASQNPCGANLTTPGLRSESRSSCVNLPGFYYSQDAQGNPVASPCPEDTWSPGLKKQPACSPCPGQGFTTNGMTQCTSAASCVVPPGSYLKAPGLAAPCPGGQYKEAPGSNDSCRQCSVTGVTTAREGSTSAADCSHLQPGFYATALSAVSGAITAAAVCPAGFICQGGKPVRAVPGFSSNGGSNSNSSTQLGLQLDSVSDPTVTPCPSGTVTQAPGASSLDQCLTPPGHYTDTATGKTLKCPAGTYRPDWKLPSQAASCVPCGEGVSGEPTGRLMLYAPGANTPVQEAVSDSPESCFILPGWGLYFSSTTNTWRAQKCDDSQFGATKVTYGLTPLPCRDCPAGTVSAAKTSTTVTGLVQRTSAAGTAAGCVTKPGYCVTSPGAVGPCPLGMFNEGGNLDSGQACPPGTTTSGPGEGRSRADCLVAVGYGFDGASISACPTGTFNDVLHANMDHHCQPCPLPGTTTASVGSTSKADCRQCAPGYGGWDCATACGGVGEAATFGPPGRSINVQCISCSDLGPPVGFSFRWGYVSDLFVAQTVARRGARSSMDCLAEYAQLDGSFYLPTGNASGTATAADVASFAACVGICSGTSGCQLASYDYSTQTCTTRVPVAPGPGEAEVILALKGVLARASVSSMQAGGSAGVRAAVLQQEGAPGMHAGDHSQPGAVRASVVDNDSDSTPTQEEVAAKVVGSGKYTFYQDRDALQIGLQQPAPGAASFRSALDCMSACDVLDTCAGFTLSLSVPRPKIGSTCWLVFGDPHAQSKRTVYKTDVSRLGLPSEALCPSGYQTAEAGTQCVPIRQGQAATFVLTAQGFCGAVTSQSVQGAVTDFLSDSDSAFGVYTPRLQVEVSCLSAGQQTVPVAPTAGNTSVIAVTIKARYTGTHDGATALAQQLSTDACGIPRLCSPTLRQATLLRRWLDPASIKQGSLELSVSGSRQGNVTQVVAAALHKEQLQGLVTDMPIFISLGGPAAAAAAAPSSAGLNVTDSGWVCAASSSGGRSLLTCSAPNVLPRSQLVVIATAPNIETPGQPLTASATYFT